MTVFAHFRGMKTANRRMCTRGADVSGFVHTARTDVRDAMLCGSRRPVHARRLSAAPHLGGSLFLGTLYMVHTSCVSNTPFPGWGFRRLRTAGTVSKRIDTPYGGFYPLGTPSSALFGIPRRTERLRRSYLCSGPKKERQYRYHLIGSAERRPFLSQLRSSR